MPVARSALRNAHTFQPKSFLDTFGYTENPITTRGGIYLIGPTSWQTPQAISGLGAFPATYMAGYDDAQIAVDETVTWNQKRYYRGVMSVASGAFARAATNGNKNHEVEFLSHIVWDNVNQTIYMYEMLFGFDGAGYAYQWARHNGTIGASFGPPAGFSSRDPSAIIAENSNVNGWQNGDIIEMYVDMWRFTVYHTPDNGTGTRYLLCDYDDVLDTTNRLTPGGRSGYAFFNRDDSPAGISANTERDFGWQEFFVSEAA